MAGLNRGGKVRLEFIRRSDFATRETVTFRILAGGRATSRLFNGKDARCEHANFNLCGAMGERL